MTVDVKTAAFMLGTSEEMLLRWVRQGAIPVIEADNTVFFDERQLSEWATKRHMPIRRTPAVEVREVAKDRLSLVSAVMKGGIHFRVPGKSVAEVLAAALDRIEEPLQIAKTELLERLLARESSASTGIGEGVAVPHPGRPLTGVPDGGIVTVCFLENPVDFHAADQKPVFVLFIILSPSSKRHLELLSKVALSLGNREIAEVLASCDSAETLLTALAQLEIDTRLPS